MTARKLEKSEWGPFFDAVSKHLAAEKDGGAEAEIEIASLKLGDQVQARWLPLFGITYDPKDDLIEVAVKGLDHLIRKPRDVFVEEEAGKLASVEIVDGDGAQQIVRLRPPLEAPRA